jgi:hypothetical protein
MPPDAPVITTVPLEFVEDIFFTSHLKFCPHICGHRN